MNVYGMARAFHEAYGIQSVAYAGAELAPTRFSKIVKINQVEGFDHDPGFTETLIKLGKNTYNDPAMKYLLIPCGDGYGWQNTKKNCNLIIPLSPMIIPY